MSDPQKRFEEVNKRFQEVRELFPTEPDLVMVEELAEEIGRRMPKVPKRREAVTRTLDHKNQIVKNAYNLVNVTNVRGELKELVIRSPSQNFGVYILADGVTKLARSYTNLTGLSPHSEFMDAYEEAGDGVYVVKLKEMSWLENFLATVNVSETITFYNLWALWNEYIV